MNIVPCLKKGAELCGRVTVWWPLAVFYLAAAVFRKYGAYVIVDEGLPWSS